MAIDVDFDVILAKCGDNQRYQYLLLALYGYIMFVTSRHYFSQNVIGFMPDHWCHHEHLENRSFAEIEAIYAKYENPSCTRLDWIDGNEAMNATVSSQRCDRWIYNYDYGFRSINAEFNWVCDAALKGRVGQSLFFVGSMFGTFIFGLLGDRIGRIKTLILANWCGFLGDFATIFAQDLTAYSVSRFISGLAAEANSYLMYILVLEYISPSLRNIGLNTVLGIFYCLGLISASWQARFVGDWRSYMMWTAFPSLLVTSFYFLIHESAQWLITRNDIDGAISRLQRVAKFNKREVSEMDFEDFRKHCSKSSESTKSKEDTHKLPGLLDALKTPRLRKTVIEVLILFMIITVCYNTMARNVEGVGISPFIMFTLNALTLPPSGLVQAQLQERFGRKFTLVSSVLLTGLFTAAYGTVLTIWKQVNVTLLVALLLTSRFGISVATGATMQFCTELIPTCVRSQILAVGTIAGAAASFLSPYIQYLDTYSKAGPATLLFLLFIVCTWLCLLLPETSNKKLPISLVDGEQFGVGEGMFDFLRKRRSNKVDKVDASAETQEKLMPE
ncbi:organic cation transporter-like protein isoform X1 [Drosophila tropicalis]|uniref:organic cation transporter-like protein isoform X1 n=2 Tax=Drosophila tropicalis TaxID=46794 RepID=UPI0035ABC67B